MQFSAKSFNAPAMALRSVISRLNPIRCFEDIWSLIMPTSPIENTIEQPEQVQNTPFKKLNDSLWELYAPPDGKAYDSEVIFVHDLLLGDSKAAWRTTWTNKAGKCWPRELWKDKYPTARILSVTYDSSVDQTDTHGRMDLLLITEQLLHNFFLAGVGQTKNCPLMFVGHGLGCFVIKDLINRASRVRGVYGGQKEQNFLNNVGGFVFYSPFNKGVSWNLFHVEPGTSGPLKKYEETNNSRLSRLNDSFSKLRRKYQEKKKSNWDVDLWKVLVICESQPTPQTRDLDANPGMQGANPVYVCEASARADCEVFLTVEADHFKVCIHERDLESGFLQTSKWLDEIRDASRRQCDSTDLDTYPWEILPEHLFDRLFPSKDPFYTYESFIEAIKAFQPGFCVTGNSVRRKRELAAFLAHIDHGTSGLIYREEQSPWDNYCQPSPEFPCYPGKSYHGRGPIQMCWNYNYKLCGKAINEDLVSSPEKVSEDPIIAFKSAIWFWCTDQWNKPSCHSVMTGLWKPTPKDIAANRLPGFGVTTDIINGGFECGMYSPKADSRWEKYKKFCSVFDVKPGENLNTRNQQPFDSNTM